MQSLKQNMLMIFICFFVLTLLGGCGSASQPSVPYNQAPLRQPDLTDPHLPLIFDIAIPDFLPTQPARATTVAAGYAHTMAITADGRLWAWGSNVVGQVGNNSQEHQHSPVHIMDDVVAVAAGSWHSMAIRSDGSLWAWGANARGQLGSSYGADQRYPIHIIDDVIAVSAGMYHTLAIRSDGSLWGWGWNSLGQIGVGADMASAILFPVHIMDGVIFAEAGRYHSMAIRFDGVLWGWGNNEHNQIRRHVSQNQRNQYMPLRIMDNVQAVAIGGPRTMAIQTCGSLFMWGHHWDEPPISQDSARISYSQPTHAINHVAVVSVGGIWHTSIIRTDGTLWTWGGNYVGQLGDGTTVGRRHPQHLMDDVVTVSAAPWHTIAIKSDGSLWAWGSNEVGMLGDGTTTARHTPVRIMDGIMLP